MMFGLVQDSAMRSRFFLRSFEMTIIILASIRKSYLYGLLLTVDF